MRFTALILLFANGLAQAESCPAPAICNEIHKLYDNLHEQPDDHPTFRKYLALLEKSAASTCKVPGVPKALPAYKLCFDKRFKESKDQMFVLEWFKFAEESKFPEGRKFTRGPLFQRTIDGGWAEMFNGI